MLLPYKVKNPPERFPVATVALIAANTLVFLFTSHSFLVVQREVVRHYALTWGVSPGYTMLTALFLHGSIFHLAGNMLFLWVFGPAVEDRLHIPGYLGLYLLTGFAGNVAETAIGTAGVAGAQLPILGASGCIMGVLGAYWYLFSWSPVCMFYWLGILWRGKFELAAIWVIGGYFLLDLAEGFLGRCTGACGGVANFAHVGGAFVGALLVGSLGLKRDSGEVSRVKAAQAEVKDINLLSCAEMWALVEHSPDDDQLLIEYTRKALRDGTADDVKRALVKDARTVIARCPEAALKCLLTSDAGSITLTPGDLIQVGRWCESQTRTESALLIFRKVESDFPNSPEAEHALLRAARVEWMFLRDVPAALKLLETLLTRFPAGRFMFEAEDLKEEILRQSGTDRLAA